MFEGNNKYLIYIILTLLGFVSIWIVFFAETGPKKHLYNAVPTQATLVIEIKEPAGFWETLRKTSLFWEKICKIPQMKQLELQLNQLDSLFQSFPRLHDKSRKFPAAIVLLESQKGFGFVVIAETGSALQFYDMEKAIWNTFGGKIRFVEQKLGGIQSGLLIDNTFDDQFNFVITKGLTIGSYNKELVEIVLKQLQSGSSLLNDGEFVRLRETTGQTANAGIYARYDRLAALTEVFISEEKSEAFDAQLRDFGHWISLDLSIKPDVIQAVGYTSAFKEQWMGKLNGQKAIPETLISLLPYSTQFYLHLGMSDFQSYNMANIRHEQLKVLSDEWQVDLERDFLSEVDSEIVLAFDNNPVDPLFIVKLSDDLKVSEMLEEIRLQSIGREEIRKLGNISIKHIPTTAIIPSLFGNAGESVTSVYYTFYDHYLWIANNYTRLEQSIAMLESGRTLVNNENYNSFASHLSDEANVTLYGNLRKGKPFFENFISGSFDFFWNRNLEAIRDFDGFAVQFSVQQGWVYSNFVLAYNPEYKEDSFLSWKFEMDDFSEAEPAIFTHRQSNTQYVLVSDRNHTLYFLSDEGKLIWKKRLDSEIQSRYFSVENQRNKPYFVFNTQNFIYAFDRFGNEKNGFPIRLMAQATNGLTLGYDLQSTANQIVVCCSDRLLYSFGLNGLPTQEWESPKTAEIVERPVTFLSSPNINYLVVKDIRNNTRVFDDKGQQAIFPKVLFGNSVNNDFYLNKTNAKGVLLSTDNQGNILYLTTSGQVNLTSFYPANPEHYFTYTDYKNDLVMDFMFVNGNELNILDRFKRSLYKYQFEYPVTADVRQVLSSSGEISFSFKSETDDIVYLFDNQGIMSAIRGLTSGNPFLISFLGNEKEKHLITTKGNQLYNYLIY